MDVVDLASLEVVDRLALPDVPAAADAVGRPWVRLAPLVDTLAGLGMALITVNWWVEDTSTRNPAAGHGSLVGDLR